MLKTLDNRGKIVVTGVGKSGKVAQKTAATFSSTGSLAVFLHPTEGLHGDLGIVRPEDTVIALSQTGNTDELLRLIPSLKKMAVPIIGMGGNSHSQLARECAAWLDTSVEEEACPHDLAPTTSTTVALAVGDALAITLMQMRGFDRQAFARLHPGGALGRRLQLQVKDLMHSGSALATVPLDAGMKEVVLRSTEKKLGAALVVEGDRLAGIITDGDLRRALQHEERFFKMTAAEVMTVNPITVLESRLATFALETMENRSSQISVLPVVDETGHWKGLVRLHDLLKSL